MKLTETIDTSLYALYQNKVRTFLTMLGVIIGVFSVVTLVALVRGVRNYVTDQFDALGSNLVFVYPGASDLMDDPALAFTSNKLSKKHITLIEKDASDYLHSISPVIATGRTVKYKTKQFYATIAGGNYSYAELTDVAFAKGRNFTKVEEKSAAKVALIGPLVEKELFGNINPLGKRIKIDNTSFEVIGTLVEKGADFDEQIIIPYTTAEDVLNLDKYTYIAVKLQNADVIDLATKQIEIALMKDLKDDEFTLYSQKDLLDSIQSILGILSLGLGAIAGISLVVGGIGIMNIMLVTVTERIREIGLRKALGATSFNIGLQFMIESILISLVGGSIGLVLGWLSTFVAQKWLRAEVPLWTVGLAFGFSMIVGVIFGTYPAIQASKLDPIKALKYE